MTFIKQACSNVTMHTYLELENVLDDNASGEELSVCFTTCHETEILDDELHEHLR